LETMRTSERGPSSVPDWRTEQLDRVDVYHEMHANGSPPRWATRSRPGPDLRHRTGILCRSAVARFCSAGGADRSPAALGSRPATSPWDALNNRQTKGTGDP